jgi:hypothetical protein
MEIHSSKVNGDWRVDSKARGQCSSSRFLIDKRNLLALTGPGLMVDKKETQHA